MGLNEPEFPFLTRSDIQALPELAFSLFLRRLQGLGEHSSFRKKAADPSLYTYMVGEYPPPMAVVRRGGAKMGPPHRNYVRETIPRGKVGQSLFLSLSLANFVTPEVVMMAEVQPAVADHRMGPSISHFPYRKLKLPDNIEAVMGRID